MPCNQVDVPKWSGRPFFWVLGFSANVVRHVCRELVSSDCPHTVGQQLRKGGPDGQIPELELYLQGKFLSVSIWFFFTSMLYIATFHRFRALVQHLFRIVKHHIPHAHIPSRVDFALPLNYVLGLGYWGLTPQQQPG